MRTTGRNCLTIEQIVFRFSVAAPFHINIVECVSITTGGSDDVFGEGCVDSEQKNRDIVAGHTWSAQMSSAN